MPRDSNGNASTDPVYVATPGTTIRAVQHNTPIADIIQMLTGSLARNGTGGMLADLAMGGFKITGLADGTNAQDAVTKAQLDATLDDLPYLGAWTNVASASTVNLGAQASRNLVITGTTTITSFGTAGAADNVPYLLRFSGVLTLTHSTDLILPGGANITTAAGDVAIVVHDTASLWRVVGYSRAAMPPLIAGTAANNLVKLDESSRLPAVDGSLITGRPEIGVGQYWIDVTGWRSLGTVYTNTTGKPICISCVVAIGSSPAGVAVYVGGIAAYDVYAGVWPSNSSTTVSAIVPVGATYQVTAYGGGGTKTFWSELR